MGDLNQVQIESKSEFPNLYSNDASLFFRHFESEDAEMKASSAFENSVLKIDESVPFHFLSYWPKMFRRFLHFAMACRFGFINRCSPT